METIKPIKPIPLNVAKKTNNETVGNTQPLNAAEQGKLWATYMGNTMSMCVLSYFLNHVDDPEIKTILEKGMSLSQQFIQKIKELYTQENYPVPKGFSQEDVNPGAPRLFLDPFYLHYLKYVGKAALSIYGIAVPLMVRPDCREFFTSCLESSIQFLNQVNELMLSKGMTSKPAYIPYPARVDFIQKQNYLNGFLGRIRPLQALEITHLYDNVENNATSKAVLIGFAQAAKAEQVKAYFQRGKAIADKHYEILSKILEDEDLTSTPTLDPFVTNSTFSPFSDKLMVYHKLDMFSMRIRAYANAISMSSRHDISEKYARILVEVGNYSEDGANILIEHGLLEQPPQAADREALASK